MWREGAWSMVSYPDSIVFHSSKEDLMVVHWSRGSSKFWRGDFNHETVENE